MRNEDWTPRALMCSSLTGEGFNDITALITQFRAEEHTKQLITKRRQSQMRGLLENTGGPSGGVIFTLGLIDLLTPEDLLQGRDIAGTGTISANGKVGAIGGVTEKIIGAKKAGASLLFVSRENCDQLPATVDGISIIAINNIDQAIDYLLKPIPGGKPAGKDLNSARIQGCASVGA